MRWPKGLLLVRRAQQLAVAQQQQRLPLPQPLAQTQELLLVSQQLRLLRQPLALVRLVLTLQVMRPRQLRGHLVQMALLALPEAVVAQTLL